MEARSVHLLTWNVGRSVDALWLAIGHIARKLSARQQGPWIVALQEVPVRDLPEMLLGDQIRTRSQGTLGLVTYLEGQGPARTRSAKCIVSTLDLVAEKPPRQEKEHGRFVGAAFADLRGEWRDLAVACVHAVSKKDPRGRESADRHAAARELRSAVERFAGGRPLAVLGDLNADPYEEELLHEEGWYAFRERERLRCWQDKPGRSHGGPRGLFNPMWGLLRDASPWGTLAYDKRPHTAKLWHHMDQILVSDELADHLAPPEILETLNAEDGEQKLTTAGGKRTRYSDHLPVYAALRVNEVNRCHPSNSN